MATRAQVTKLARERWSVACRVVHDPKAPGKEKREAEAKRRSDLMGRVRAIDAEIAAAGDVHARLVAEVGSYMAGADPARFAVTWSAAPGQVLRFLDLAGVAHENPVPISTALVGGILVAFAANCASGKVGGVPFGMAEAWLQASRVAELRAERVRCKREAQACDCFRQRFTVVTDHGMIRTQYAAGDTLDELYEKLSPPKAVRP